MGNIFAFLRSCVDNECEIIDGLLENNETDSNVSDHIDELFQYLNNIENDSTDEEEFPYNPFGFEEQLPSYASEEDEELPSYTTEDDEDFPLNPFGDEEELPSYTSEDEVNFPLNPFGDEEPAIFPIEVEEELPLLDELPSLQQG